jgi:hypothetical protein
VPAPVLGVGDRLPPGTVVAEVPLKFHSVIKAALAVPAMPSTKANTKGTILFIISSPIGEKTTIA